MTFGVILFIAISVGLLLALFYLLGKPRTGDLPTALAGKPQIEDLFPLHCRHFPQMRQALSAADEEFVKRRCSRKAGSKWRAERRRALRRFLAGLGEDFARLDRLSRTLVALSPQASRAQQAEWSWLGLRFRLLYPLVDLRLATGSPSLGQLAHLADLVGSLAAQIEAGMAALETSPAPPLGPNLTA